MYKASEIIGFWLNSEMSLELNSSGRAHLYMSKAKQLKICSWVLINDQLVLTIYSSDTNRIVYELGLKKTFYNEKIIYHIVKIDDRQLVLKPEAGYIFTLNKEVQVMKYIHIMRMKDKDLAISRIVPLFFANICIFLLIKHFIHTSIINYLLLFIIPSLSILYVVKNT